MATKHDERVRVIRGEGYARKERVVEHTPPTQQVIVSRVSKLMWLIAAIVVTVISFRFLLLMIGANPSNEFVNLLYNFTDVIVGPFNGIVNSPEIDGSAFIDTASIFAVVVYVLLIWAFVTLFRIVFSATNSTRHTTTYESEQ